MSPDRARARAAYCSVSRPWLRESAWVARFRAVQNFPTQFQGLKDRLIRLPLRGSLNLIRADCGLGRASGQSLCLVKSALICRCVRLRLETQAAAIGCGQLYSRIGYRSGWLGKHRDWRWTSQRDSSAEHLLVPTAEFRCCPERSTLTQG